MAAAGSSSPKARAAKAPAAKPAAATKSPAAKAPAKKAPAKKSPAAKAPAKKAPAAKAPAKKSPAAKSPAKKSPAKKSPAAKAPAKKSPAAKAPAKKSPAAKAPAKKSPATKAPAKKAPGRRSLVVREDESPWTPAEIALVRRELEADVIRLQEEIATAEADIADLVRDSGDGAGDDQADAGSKTFEREHEMSLANNARDMLAQVEHALMRIDDGTYGGCESCGRPVGKLRLQAFPRATMCKACKEIEERRAL